MAQAGRCTPKPCVDWGRLMYHDVCALAALNNACGAEFDVAETTSRQVQGGVLSEFLCLLFARGRLPNGNASPLYLWNRQASRVPGGVLFSSGLTFTRSAPKCDGATCRVCVIKFSAH